MSERSYSHKSDGRQSSAGHSVHSLTSGRANSLTGFGLTPPADPPGLAPGLFILGSVPAIIRCWLNTNFKHDTLLYAAVCSGSFTSYLDSHLVEHLGFQEQITVSDDGTRKIKLSVYLPEAVPVSSSSRSTSPAPQLPSLGVDFTIADQGDTEINPKAIQIFLGSDLLRAHSADLLFSSNQLTLYDDDDTKLQIPLIRPEDERTFKSLALSSTAPASKKLQCSVGTAGVAPQSDFGGGPSIEPATRESYSSSTKFSGNGTTASSDDGASSGRRSLEQRPYLGTCTSNRSDAKDDETSSVSAGLRAAASPAVWGNWRRDQSEKINSGSLDWANVGKTTSSSTGYQRRDTGMKVLKPSKPARAMSTSASTPSPVTGQSRFFDDGKRRGEGGFDAAPTVQQARATDSSEKVKENTPSRIKTRSANPVGGASAFAWLNGGGSK